MLPSSPQPPRGPTCEAWALASLSATEPSGRLAPKSRHAESRSLVNLVGKGKRLRTIPVPSWSKELLDAWLRHSGVIEGKVFRRVLKGGTRQEAGVTANVVWYAVKRCASQAGIANLAPHDLRRTCARLCHGCGGELEQIQFLLGHASVQQRNGASAANRSFKMP